MDWVAVFVSAMSGLFGAILGSVITGYFTYKTAKMNLVHEDEMKAKEEKKEAHATRPEFQIVSSSPETKLFDKDETCDITLLFLPIEGFSDPCIVYPKAASDDSKLVEDAFVFKNIGKTDISNFWISTNIPRGTALFNFYSARYYRAVEKGILSYRVCYDKIIRPGDEVTIRILSISNRRQAGTIEAALNFWICDCNGRWWSQAFFFPEPKVYTAQESSNKEFNDYTSEDVGLSCFRNPYMW
jgi:hypothetical protein